jgi:hypothetical protein
MSFNYCFFIKNLQQEKAQHEYALGQFVLFSEFYTLLVTVFTLTLVSEKSNAVHQEKEGPKGLVRLY